MAFVEGSLGQDKKNGVVQQAKEFYSKKLPVDAGILTEDQLAQVVPPPFNIRTFIARLPGKASAALSPITPSLSRFLGNITGM